MTGKVFSQSNSIYEDEAKILFDYYRKAAEKIVEEEISIEEKIKDEEGRKTAAANSHDRRKTLTIIAAIIAVVSLILAIVLYLFGNTVFSNILCVMALAYGMVTLINIPKIKKAKESLDRIDDGINDLKEKKANIRRDYKVSKLGVAYVPVAVRVPFEGKSFIVDYTGTKPNTDFNLSVLNQPKELQSALSNLEKNLDSFPIVEGNDEAETLDTSAYSKSVQSVTMHDYMGGIDRELRNISYLLNDSDIRAVSLPVIAANSDEEQFLNEYATTETGENPIVRVYETDGLESKIDAFMGMNGLKNGSGNDFYSNNFEYFTSLIRKLGDSVQLVSKLKTSSTSKLLDYTNSILAAVLKAGYNQYSTELEAEELERIRNTRFDYQDCIEDYRPFELKKSSRVRYDIYNHSWVAEDGTKTNMPFGINQIEEEVLMPLINNLMLETRIERFKVYNNIKDQKLSYLNKWHQDVEAAFRDNRRLGQDLISQITEAYTEYTIAHNTYISYKQTLSSLKNMDTGTSSISDLESADDDIKEIEDNVEKCKEIGDSFQLYMRKLQEDINAASERFGFVEYYEGSLRDGESKKIACSIVPESLQNLPMRRKRMVAINSYFATYADLPPEPSVEQSLIDDFAVDLEAIATEHISKIEVERSRVSNVSNQDDSEEITVQDDAEEGDE